MIKQEQVEWFITILSQRNIELSRRFQLRVIRALGEIGDPRAIPTLLQLLKEGPSEEIKKAAAWSLGEIGDERAIEPLVKALQDFWPDVRSAAVEAQAKIGAPAIALLLQMLQDEDPEVRVKAAWALRKIADAKAVPPLIQALTDEAFDVRRTAATALDALGDRRVVA